MWVKINGSTKTMIERYPDSVVHPTLQCWFIAFHSYNGCHCFSSFENFHPGSQLQGCKTWVRTKGLMYCQNPTAVWDHFLDTEFQIQCSKKTHLGANIHHLTNPLSTSGIYRYNSFSTPKKKHLKGRWKCLSSISIDSRSLPTCSPLREAQRLTSAQPFFGLATEVTIDLRKLPVFQGWVQ